MNVPSQSVRGIADWQSSRARRYTVVSVISLTHTVRFFFWSQQRSFSLATITHVEQIRRELPATTAHIYLNTGTFGPLPTCVTQAIQTRLQQEWQDGRI